MEMFKMWLRVFDSTGVAISAVVVASVCRWWLKDKLVGHRRAIKTILWAVCGRGLGAVIAAGDFYVHGALTQIISSFLTIVFWVVISLVFIRERENFRRTLRASETEEILRIEAQLDGQTLSNVNNFRDDESLRLSRELLASQGIRGRHRAA